MGLSRRRFLTGVASAAVLGYLGQGRLFGGAKEVTASRTMPEPPEEPAPVPCDYVLAGGDIVDGLGQPRFKGDVGVKDGRIVAVGRFTPEAGARVLDVSGLVVAPGFIDLHTHTEQYIRKDGRAGMVLLQGVTSQIGANCGTSVPSIQGYFDSLGQTGVNIGLFVGYKTARKAVVGDAPRKATPQEVFAMQEEVAKGMQAGAFGLSVGLSYWPQILATTEEMVELCQAVRDYGGFYSTHIRDEQDDVLPSVEEAIEIGLRAGLPVEYSHVKTAQRQNWGKMARVLEMVEGAGRSGLDITGDTYGYTFSSLDLGSSRESMSEEDVRMALSHPLIMIGSDSGLNLDGSANHPRAYGNYPRILGRYVREQSLLTLEETVRKMTSMPAKRLGLRDRGLLAEGFKADITVFDPGAINDRSTRENPSLPATGVTHVLVNGRLAVEAGRPTGVLAGEQLKSRV